MQIYCMCATIRDSVLKSVFESVLRLDWMILRAMCCRTLVKVSLYINHTSAKETHHS